MPALSQKKSEPQKQEAGAGPRPSSGGRAQGRLSATLSMQPQRGSRDGARPDYFQPLRSPGEPLGGGTRERMEARLGHPLGEVRVHAGPEAARSAEALGADAYTVGRDVVMGRVGGDELLAHELGHAVRQRLVPAPPSAAALSWTSPGDAVEREAASGRRPVPGTEPLALAAAWRWDVQATWRRFDTARDENRTGEAMAAAEEIVTGAVSDREGWTEHGVDLALWLLDNGRPDLAERALRSARDEWLVNSVLEKDGKVPFRTDSTSPASHPGAVAPEKLVERARAAARADQHTLAFRLFGQAFLFMQLQLVAVTERREAEIDEKPGAALVGVARPETYRSAAGIYDRMRDVLGFYHDLAREARDAGDVELARTRSGLAAGLAAELEARYGWSGEAMTGEFTPVDTSRGPALRLHGANQAEADLTRLPGLPPPDEVRGRVHLASLEDVRETLAGQASLLAELRDDPEVRREFGTATIDMDDPAQRLRVWGAMYRSYGSRGAASRGPLHSLMTLVGRYLRAFTRHSQYNVRDFGTSYLDSTLPTDLADRAVRDCGVYALTVAWEVFRTVRVAAPNKKVSFDLVFSPDHVVLVIESPADKETFVVSNDQVVPVAKKKEVGQAISKQFAMQPGRGSVAFGRRVSVGSTDVAEEAFRTGLWESYRKEGVSFRPEPPSGPGDTRSEAERYEAAAGRYYQVQDLYDRGQEVVRGDLSALDAEIAAGNEAGALARHLPGLVAKGRALAELFIEISRYQKGMPGGTTIWHAVGPPPLVRVALLLLRRAQLGTPPSTGEVELIRFVGAAFGNEDVQKHSHFPNP